MRLKKNFLSLLTVVLTVVFCACGASACSSSNRSTYKWVRSVIDEHYYEDLPDDATYNGDINEFVSTYLDIYSAYYTAAEYKAVNASNAGSKSGLGVSYMYISESDNHPEGKSGILLERVLGDSPAWKAGLRAGEFLLSGTANGTTTYFISTSSFSSFLSSMGDGEEFTLTSDKGTYTVAKAEYTASYCYMATNEKTYTIEYSSGSAQTIETDGGKTALPDGAAYLKLDQFYGNAATETATLIEKFNALGCTSLILDLRGNGGGYLDVMCEISAVFTRDIENATKVATYAQYKDGSTYDFEISSESSFSLDEEQLFKAGTKLSILCDNGTASASEALIGVLICNGVADYSDVYISDLSEAYLTRTVTTSKNCRTYGKGIMQSTYTRPLTGEALKLTTARIYWPNGVTIHGTGLGTDMGCNTLKASWDVTYDDEQLSLAVQAIYD